ncbi:MAG: hypothetical protein KF841_07985 [Phycisphaerae bacterium]|nr:hypothetical protein [Phycisphaerae bacterium]
MTPPIEITHEGIELHGTVSAASGISRHPIRIPNGTQAQIKLHSTFLIEWQISPDDNTWNINSAKTPRVVPSGNHEIRVRTPIGVPVIADIPYQLSVRLV